MTIAANLQTALLGPRSAPLWIRVARIVIAAVVIGVGVDQLVSAIREWPLHDMDTYLAAAARLRDGRSPYPRDVAYAAYWYAPWFAVAWIPFTFLPRIVVAVLWSSVLLVATGLICFRLGRLGPSGLLLAMLLGPSLFAVSAGGNVQALILLPLLDWPIRRRCAVWLGVIASLKLTPIILVLVFVRRGQWRQVLVTIGIAAVLIGPGIAMGLFGPGSSTDWGESLLGLSPVLYIGAVLASAYAVFIVPDRFATAAGMLASVLALPRLFVYDSTLLVGGLAAGTQAEMPAEETRRREADSRPPATV